MSEAKNEETVEAKTQPTAEKLADMYCLSCKSMQKDVVVITKPNKLGRPQLHGTCDCGRRLSRLPKRDPDAPKPTKVKKVKGPTVVTLRARAKELRIRRYGKMKKAELIEAIAKEEESPSSPTTTATTPDEE